jgi:hypothetical protein
LTDYDRGARAPLVISEGLRRGLGALVTAAGAACVAAGVAIVGCLAWLVYLLVEEPGRVPFASRLIELGSGGKWAARGTLEGSAFELELGAPLYWLVVAFITVLLFAVAAGVAKGLISAGVSLLGRMR